MHCEAAAVLQYVQYKALFEGFLARMWAWYTGVVMWKSQSPWPTLRGALYDTYLDQTGGYHGTQSAAKELLHVQLDLLTLDLSVCSRLPATVRPVRVEVAVYGLPDAAPLALFSESLACAPPHAVTRLPPLPCPFLRPLPLMSCATG